MANIAILFCERIQDGVGAWLGAKTGLPRLRSWESLNPGSSPAFRARSWC